ncbi:hypothetical protein FRB98_006000, partial [Tulasnella sp. 332]
MPYYLLSSLLHPQELPMEFLSFSGKKTEDETIFLQDVKRLAFTEGRSRDNDWLVDYVETCLTGAALDWYSQLDEKVQMSWKQLRLALLQSFTARGDLAIPAPPAAAPPGS